MKTLKFTGSPTGVGRVFDRPHQAEIPDSVTLIEASAFSCCSSLASVSMGHAVASIESGAFYSCTNLAEGEWIPLITNPPATSTSLYFSAPQFVNAAAGNYRISMASPCIDAGSNACVNVATDLDGNPRIAHGLVDMGAYEYAGAVDSDGGLFFDDEEYIAGTCPTNSASFFAITNAWMEDSGYVIEWAPTVTGRWYSIVWTNHLTGGFTSLVSGIDFPQNSHTDTTHTTQSEGFYRVEVELK